MQRTLHLLTRISNLQCRKTGYDFQRLHKTNIGFSSHFTLRMLISVFIKPIDGNIFSQLPFGLVRSPCMVSGLLRFFNI